MKNMAMANYSDSELTVMVENINSILLNVDNLEGEFQTILETKLEEIQEEQQERAKEYEAIVDNANRRYQDWLNSRKED